MTRSRDQGFTLIELLIVIAVVSIIAAIATPGLLRARMTANETSALASLKTVASAQVAYSSSCGRSAFATTFVILGTPAPGTNVGFISADLGLAVAPLKGGYAYTLGNGAGASAGPADCNGVATTTAYYATAAPQQFGVTGSRSFATNVGVAIWQVNAAAPPTEPFGPPATTIQ
jgi:type IV pilus assembly protein PilA